MRYQFLKGGDVRLKGASCDSIGVPPVGICQPSRKAAAKSSWNLSPIARSFNGTHSEQVGRCDHFRSLRPVSSVREKNPSIQERGLHLRECFLGIYYVRLRISGRAAKIQVTDSGRPPTEIPVPQRQSRKQVMMVPHIGTSRKFCPGRDSVCGTRPLFIKLSSET